MLVIGERINGMFEDVKAAVRDQNKSIIQDLAKRQLECGANVLDINVGTAARDREAAMKWLVEVVQEVTDAPLALDNPKPAVIKSVIGSCSNKVFINSTDGSEAKMGELFPLAAEHNASIIALTMNEEGVPPTADKRVEIAATIFMAAMEHGITNEDLYIDSIILPCNVPGKTVSLEVLEAIRQIQFLSDPPPHTVLGLSNVSQSTQERPLINRTYLVMVIAAGLDAAILDPMDTELVDAMITAEMLMGRSLYCDSFLKAYRERQ